MQWDDDSHFEISFKVECGGTPVIPVNGEPEIGGLRVPGQPKQKLRKSKSKQNTSKRAGGMDQEPKALGSVLSTAKKKKKNPKPTKPNKQTPSLGRLLNISS
jgi:hypothetical protein